jgi:lipopolysaccharide/colanic/teichoic acid biosynthesis glycosyltransferase
VFELIQRFRYWVLSADLVWITLAPILAVDLSCTVFGQNRPELSLSRYVFDEFCILALWTALFTKLKLDCIPRGWYVSSGWFRLVMSVFQLVALLICITYLGNRYYSPFLLSVLAILLISGFVLIRYGFRSFIYSRGRKRLLRRVVILGNGRLGEEVAHKIARHPEMLLEVVGFLYPSDTEPRSGVSGPISSGTSAQTLETLELLKKWDVRELIVVLRQLGTEAQRFIDSCRKAGIGVSIVPESYDLYVSKLFLQEVDGVPLLSLKERSHPLIALEIKQCIDLMLAALLLTASSPLIAYAAFTLYWRKGHAFMTERRCGKDGREFSMYRLNVDRKVDNQNGLERLLALLSLTELPELWNVLRGEMSLVGPRPESPDRVKHYSDWQRQRLNVKPGLSGLAQVHGLREENSSEEKSRFDMQYIFDWSPVWDLVLLLRTPGSHYSRLRKDDRSLANRELKIAENPSTDFSEISNANRAQSSSN